MADHEARSSAACRSPTFPGWAGTAPNGPKFESVRIRSDLRGNGLGRQFMAWAIDQARARGCALVQLTTDKARRDAHRFYAGLGFVASHEGLKLAL